MTITLNHYCGSFALMSIREKYGSDRITTRGNNMSEPFSGVTGALIMKFGFLKIIGCISAVSGALMMLMVDIPTKKILFIHIIVAALLSIFVGGTIADVIAKYTHYLDINTAPYLELAQFTGAVQFAVGAFGWGIVGAIRYLNKKMCANPIKLVKDVKNIL